jgi:hypothetical protein
MDYSAPTILERLRYWQGQKLRAADFRDQLARDAQFRWWHNRALHNTFGVSHGLQVSVEPGLNKKILAVKVTPGLAYDCFGHEVELRTPVAVELSRGAGPMMLLIFYQGATRSPGFVWKSKESVKSTDGVPLAELSDSTSVKGEKLRLQSVPLFAQRALRHPRIGVGQTVPGDTLWELWSEEFAGTSEPQERADLGVQVTVDTAAAGFGEMPSYFAWLQGRLWHQPNVEFFPLPLTHVDAETPTNFRFRLWMPPLPALLGSRLRFANQNPFAKIRSEDAKAFKPDSEVPDRTVSRFPTSEFGFKRDFVNFAREQQLCVGWFGVECAPNPNFEAAASSKCFNEDENDGNS